MKQANKLLSIITGTALLLGTSCNQRMYQQGVVQGTPKNMENKTRLELLEGVELAFGGEQTSFAIEDVTRIDHNYTGKVAGFSFYKKHFHIGTSYLFPAEKIITNQDDYWLIDKKPDETNNMDLRERVDIKANLVSYPAIHLSYNLAYGKNSNISLGMGYRPLFVEKTGTSEQYRIEDKIIDGYWEEIEHKIKSESINQQEDKSAIYFRVANNFSYIGIWTEMGFGVNPEAGYMMRIGATLNIPLKQQKKLLTK